MPGHYAGIDEEGRLIELGWSKWPTLMHLAWQGQWEQYLHNLKANLSRPALTVPIFTNQVSVLSQVCHESIRYMLTLPNFGSQFDYTDLKQCTGRLKTTILGWYLAD